MTYPLNRSDAESVGANLVFAQGMITRIRPRGDHKDRPYERCYNSNSAGQNQILLVFFIIHLKHGVRLIMTKSQ